MMETSKVIGANPKSGSGHLGRWLWGGGWAFGATKFVKWAEWKAGKA